MIHIINIIWVLFLVPIFATEIDIIQTLLAQKESMISAHLFTALKTHVFIETCSKNITGLTVDNYLNHLKTDDSIVVMERDNNILSDIQRRSEDRFVGKFNNNEYYVIVSDLPPLDEIYCGFKITDESECKHDSGFSFAKCLLLYLNEYK